MKQMVHSLYRNALFFYSFYYVNLPNDKVQNLNQEIWQGI